MYSTLYKLQFFSAVPIKFSWAGYRKWWLSSFVCVLWLWTLASSHTISILLYGHLVASWYQGTVSEFLTKSKPTIKSGKSLCSFIAFSTSAINADASIVLQHKPWLVFTWFIIIEKKQDSKGYLWTTKMNLLPKKSGWSAMNCLVTSP